MKKTIIAAVLAIVSAMTFTAFAQNKEDAIVGVYYTEGNLSKVEMYKDGDKYAGRLIWIEAGDQEDVMNPDESLRTRHLVGLTIVTQLEPDGKGGWNNGKVYDPESGKTYSASAKLEGKDLKFRGYLGVKALGRTTTWTRVN